MCANNKELDGTASRLERDGLGTQPVPARALYGLQTARALANFDTGAEKLSAHPGLIASLARVKAAAAKANVELDVIPAEIGAAIVRAAREVAAGEHDQQFPLEIVQGGGGTSTNMNMNEVLANRAGELLGAPRGTYDVVHPNDHVNRGQSTNDVLPTATGIAVHDATGNALRSLAHLHRGLLGQAAANEGLEHLGRTCLRDAVPVPVSAVHGAQAHALARAAEDLRGAAQRLLEVPLGATAVGTGVGADPGFQAAAIRHLSDETGLDLSVAEDQYDVVASLEPFAAVADAMARAGRVIARVAADLRLLASGPAAGIGEIELPATQAGSSIMPGKVNPVIPEHAIQISFQLAGAAHVVRLAAAAGELEVTPMGPVVTAELMRGLRCLDRVAVLFADRCIDGLCWRRDVVEANLSASLHGAVESAGVHGYDAAARLIQERANRS